MAANFTPFEFHDLQDSQAQAILPVLPPSTPLFPYSVVLGQPPSSRSNPNGNFGLPTLAINRSPQTSEADWRPIAQNIEAEYSRLPTDIFRRNQSSSNRSKSSTPDEYLCKFTTHFCTQLDKVKDSSSEILPFVSQIISIFTLAKKIKTPHETHALPTLLEAIVDLFNEKLNNDTIVSYLNSLQNFEPSPEAAQFNETLHEIISAIQQRIGNTSHSSSQASWIPPLSEAAPPQQAIPFDLLEPLPVIPTDFLNPISGPTCSLFPGPFPSSLHQGNTSPRQTNSSSPEMLFFPLPKFLLDSSLPFSSLTERSVSSNDPTTPNPLKRTSQIELRQTSWLFPPGRERYPLSSSTSSSSSQAQEADWEGTRDAIEQQYDDFVRNLNLRSRLYNNFKSQSDQRKSLTNLNDYVENFIESFSQLSTKICNPRISLIRNIAPLYSLFKEDEAFEYATLSFRNVIVSFFCGEEIREDFLQELSSLLVSNSNLPEEEISSNVLIHQILKDHGKTSSSFRKTRSFLANRPQQPPPLRGYGQAPTQHSSITRGGSSILNFRSKNKG